MLGPTHLVEAELVQEVGLHPSQSCMLYSAEITITYLQGSKQAVGLK